MNQTYECYAACSFGLEAVVVRELNDLGIEDTRAVDARVYFSADKEGLAKANIRLRTADRVYVILKSFEAKTFDQLFEGVKAVPWGDWLPKDAKFPVTADAVKSTLGSVSDVQAVSKKAIVEALSRAYRLSFFKESGAEYEVYVSIFSDMVYVCLNSSGAGLNRRGYRVKNSLAPIRETLASGLISLSRWRDRPFYDIMCGSGTIVVEAALRAKNMVPGLRRKYGAEGWAGFSEVFQEEREKAQSEVIKKPDVKIFASDIDEKALELTRFHAARAGVADLIEIYQEDAKLFVPRTEAGTLISNPPYAMRMGEKEETEELYRAVGKRLLELPGFRYYFISSEENFEKLFGKKADKVRKLYNGNMRCNYYQYFKEK